MKDINKYRGIIPAFYACYAPDGSISTEGVKALTRHLIAKIGRASCRERV